MLSDVMNYFSLKRSFNQAGYFETPEITQLFIELRSVITQGQLIVLSGMVGCGKTTALQRLMSELATEKALNKSSSNTSCPRVPIRANALKFG
jgi:type II secretory pathway predicted ATPase ExeA